MHLRQLGILLVGIACLCGALAAKDYDDPFILREHLTTKSPYFPLGSFSEYTDPPQGCKAVYLNFVARHGARVASKGEIVSFDKLISFMKKNSAQLSDRARFGWMLDWTNPFKVEDAQQLLPIGERQHYEIAKRMAHDYPEIFDIPADINFPRAFTIRTSEVPRAAQSGISFAYGLFEGKGDLGNSDFRAFYSFSMPRNEDRELRFFKTCPKFQTEILDNDTTYWDSYKYLEMNIPPITERLRRLLGFAGLTDDHTEAMYKACAWEHSLHNTSDRWCSIFEKDDFLMFEFRDDLVFYYESGYGGRSLGYDIACPLMKDMMDRFDKKIEGHPDVEYERARLRFAHAETIIPFLTIMGIFNDSTKLSAFSSKEDIRARKYRISLMSPFAGNIAIMLYDCKSRNDGVPYRVELIHNEREFNISDVFQECKGEHYCDYRNFKKIYEDQALQCNFEQLCGIPSTSPAEPANGQGKPDSTQGPWLTISILVGIAFLVLGTVGGFVIGNRRGQKTAREMMGTYYDISDSDMMSYRQMGSDLQRTASPSESKRPQTAQTDLE
eukprot:TRINITY_DN6791_c0_g1_i1.p1 TRINITY_DN6791_c0_g1~~TRINITY_DN6791_c0_g1_i1.p1  ORF type:complete len:554 (+),score=71.50 TRINITY_DN6791_c0_g1_i1:1-1662(+)